MYGATAIGPRRVVRTTIPAGRAGTLATLRAMRSLVHAGARDLTVREAAVAIMRRANVQPHDFPGEVAALFGYVRDRIRWTRDIAGVETLQTARYTLAHGFGDCDDKAVLLGALLGSVGHLAHVFLRAVGASPSRLSHVYPVVKVGGAMLPLDPTHAGTPVGWELPSPGARLDFAL